MKTIGKMITKIVFSFISLCAILYVIIAAYLVNSG